MTTHVSKSKRYATSRQKACLNCATAKARCDHRSDGCHRCVRRGLSCQYHPQPCAPAVPRIAPGRLLAPRTEKRENGEPVGDIFSKTHGSGVWIANDLSRNCFDIDSTTWRIELGRQSQSPYHNPQHDQNQDTSINIRCSDLVCPIDAETIKNRWLGSFVPEPGQQHKAYSLAVLNYIAKMLKSYASATVHGIRIPPFVHPTQIISDHSKSTLATCLSLVHKCDNLPADEHHFVRETLRREMNILYDTKSSSDGYLLLEAFQAYLIYALVLYFNLEPSPKSILRETLMQLQDIACATAKHGLICVSEQERGLPQWESWIVVEAKRRALYIMYIFDSLLTSYDNLPILLGKELRGLPAPTSSKLWRAASRKEWELEYNRHLSDWAHPLNIEELWPMPPDFTEGEIMKRRDRIDRWLETVDEFGTMLYAITSCTHGS